MNQRLVPADILVAARACEHWRQAVEAEILAHPDARAALDQAATGLTVARDVLAACAETLAHSLAEAPRGPQTTARPQPPSNPAVRPSPFAHFRDHN
jgi:hypothetical protein